MSPYEQMRDRIAEDKTGDGFVYEMFRDELNKRGFAVTGNLNETLAALGITYEEIRAKRPLQHGLAKALREYRNQG